LTTPNWDDEQREIIRASASSRMLVEAGPGTGKTAVACARVAYLVDSKGIQASKIWLVSFTNTAVKAIRDRIVLFLNNYQDARSVKITTLDSQVWYLRQGLDEQDLQSLFQGYEANISRITQLLRQGDEPLLQFLSEIQHIIIDETQDIVGVRAELVCELIKAVSDTCGISVFADSAQAIYGFTTEYGKSRTRSTAEAVPQIRSNKHGVFAARKLNKVYRTKDEQLALSYQNLRDVVLDSEISGQSKLDKIQNVINEIAVSDLPVKNDRSLQGRKDVLLLYRQRAQVLLASSYLSRMGVAHKLRMGGQKGRLEPWIARIFSDYSQRSISENTFLERWAELVAPYGAPYELPAARQAWKDLWSHAANKRGVVQVRELKNILSRDRPPQEFLLDEDTLAGPTVGTIHGSKGREADEVRLMLSEQGDVSGDSVEHIDEEGRVTFVGATRARERLLVGKSVNSYCSKLEGNGRLFKFGFTNESPRAQVEFGKDKDVDLYRHLDADEERHNADSTPEDVQKFLWENCLDYVALVADSDGNGEFPYWLRAANREVLNIASLGDRVEVDLMNLGTKIAQKRNLNTMKPKSRIDGLYMTGAASIVLQEDDDLRHR